MIENIDGMDIYYESAGIGKPVLLLHGWGCSTETFAPVFNRLKDEFSVTSIDFPGHGKSSIPEQPIGVDDYARITKEFMQRRGLIGCDVICHSFGGRVTIKLAGTDSGVFRKLIMCDVAGIRPKRGFKYYRKVYTYKLMKRLSKLGFVCAIAKLFGVDIRAKIAGAGSDDYKVLPPVMRATFSKVVNEDLSHHLKDIKNPTLLVWGTEDRDTPLWMAEQMERDIADSGLVKFEGAGHYSYLDRFEDFLVIARHFLNTD